MINQDLLDKIYPIAEALRLYHRHQVFGLEHIPEAGAGLIVCNHSLATYDMTLLMLAIYNQKGRLVRSLIDRLFFKFPLLGNLMEVVGSVEGTQENALGLLRDSNLVAVAPGGMFEALRPSSQRYQIRWDRRKGFARLAMDTQTPIILAACPKADDIFEVYPSPLTNLIYERLRIPFFIARGLGPTPLPRPVRLTHFLSEPIVPPKPGANASAHSRKLTAFHAELIERMEELMAKAIRYRDE